MLSETLAALPGDTCRHLSPHFRFESASSDSMTTTAALRVGYTDRDTGAAAGSAVGTSNLPIMNVTNATSTASATISSSAAVFRATEIPIGAKSGVAITLYWDEGTASNCTTPPVVEIRPRLEYLGN